MIYKSIFGVQDQPAGAGQPCTPKQY